MYITVESNSETTLSLVEGVIVRLDISCKTWVYSSM
jgi:hypothetical protein